jgi:hypothetical protein
MPTFLTKDGEPIWFKFMPEPLTVGRVRFQAGDYAHVGEDAKLNRLTEEEFLEITNGLEELTVY